MFAHHLKVAFRNLQKYKTQNIISIIGLATGFACFAFSTLWLRYEMNYDSFHSKADRIYRVHTAPFKWDTREGNSLELRNCPYPLADWLKLNFPEIEEAGTIIIGEKSSKSDNFSLLYLDYAFSNIFDLNLPKDFFLRGQTPLAVIPELYNEEVKKIIKEESGWDVQMTIPRWPTNTNLMFNMAGPITVYPEQTLKNWTSRMFETYILIHNDVDIRSLKQKLDKIEMPEIATPMSLVLTPLKQLRYKDPSERSDIKFAHIQIFAIAGLLVILCSIFNHLTLHITRVRMRLRELALRKVNGATNWQIAVALYTDFLLVIVLSLVVGYMLMVCLFPAFKEYASIGSDNINIYVELLFYATLLIACGFVAGCIPILYFRKQALNDNIKGYGSSRSRNLFHKSCLLLQFIISLGMIFCTTFIIKQIIFLHYADLGINRRNIATVQAYYYQLPPYYADQIKQVHGVIDAIPINRFTLRYTQFGGYKDSFVDSTGNTVSFTLFRLFADTRFFDFFGVEIIQGTVFPNETNNYKFILNQTAMKEVGEKLSKEPGFIGVARDFHLTPTEKIKPTIIHYPTENQNNYLSAIAYKYEEGMRIQTEEAVTQWMRKEFPSQEKFGIEFTYMEDVFEEYFKSERALLKLLSVMTIVCILIAIFGVYSLTSLTCQQRRREIAIRKINGAEVVDIMNIFFKEYLILLVMAALVAFPVGYIIMKSWRNGYVKQASMDIWMFMLIFLIIFFVIVVSIISLVWKTANQNPAEVVKGE